MTTLAHAASAPRTDKLDSLALIVPVYNEAENFPALLAEIERSIPQPFVLHVVYDFDEDTTVPVARALAEDRPWLRLVKNRYGRGVVAAIRTGFHEVSEGPALVIMADLSDDLTIVPRLMDVVPPGQSHRLPQPLRPRRPPDWRATLQTCVEPRGRAIAPAAGQVPNPRRDQQFPPLRRGAG